MRRNVLFTVVAVSALLCIGVPNVRAVGGVTVNPAVLHLTMKPGEVWRGTVSVTNEFDVPIELTATTANLSRSAESDTIEVSEDVVERLGTLAAWIRPGATTFPVEGRARVTLNFSIQVPENAPPGSHRGLLVLTLDAQGPQANTLSATSAVALGVDLVVVGQPNHHIGLRDSIVSPRIGTKPPVTFLATLVNTGNTLPVVSMRAEISRIGLSRKLTVDMVPENGSSKVAPGSQTLFRGIWKAGGYVPAGIFKARIIAQDSSGVYESSRYFILVPWQVIVGVLCAGFVVLIARRFGPRVLNKRR